MMPARSPGAKPVRTAAASWGEVSHSTALIRIPARRWVSTSAISMAIARARASMPRPNSLASRPSRVSGTTMVQNASVRTPAKVRVAAIWVFTRRASSGAVGLWWAASHCSRSAPSSGTERIRNWTSLTSSVRAHAFNRPARPRPWLSRSEPSANARPGWLIAAVAAHTRDARSWIRAKRVFVGPLGGPSWTRIPASTPGRSGTPRSSVWPVAARDRHRDQRSTTPTAWARAASSQPVAERPRTGTTTRTSSTAQQSAEPANRPQRWDWTAHNTGTAATTRMPSWAPVRPRNMPTRSRV